MLHKSRGPVRAIAIVAQRGSDSMGVMAAEASVMAMGGAKLSHRRVPSSRGGFEAGRILELWGDPDDGS